MKMRRPGKVQSILEFCTFKTPIMILVVFLVFSILSLFFINKAELVEYDMYEVPVSYVENNFVLYIPNVPVDDLMKETTVYAVNNKSKIATAILKGTSYYLQEFQEQDIVNGEMVKINIRPHKRKLINYLIEYLFYKKA